MDYQCLIDDDDDDDNDDDDDDDDDDGLLQGHWMTWHVCKRLQGTTSMASANPNGKSPADSYVASPTPTN